MHAVTGTATHPNPLWRSTTDRWLAGVCGGIAAWLGWKPAVVRTLTVIGTLLAAVVPGLLVYLVLWVVMPRAPRPA
jgi:phage shock protein PspC (stress-responsive transcriptional regulator)